MSSIDTKKDKLGLDINLDIDVENELLLVSNCIQNTENREFILRRVTYRNLYKKIRS